MPDHFDFLARLGLDTSADERAIRRAYARLLKQIDQETEADRFQALREDYEHAIAWLAWRAMHARHEQEDQDDHDGEGDHNAEGDNSGHGDGADPEQPPAVQASAGPAAQHPLNASSTVHAPASASDAAPVPSSPPPAAIDLMEQIDPDALADEVFQQFLSELPNLQHGRMEFDESLWADLLRRCLADERLFNIAASSGFEFRLAYYLAGEHQRGHEALFNAAVTVFGWLTDRQRLLQFHHAGARVNRAIDERDMFNAQPMGEQRIQKQVLSAIRTRALPHPDELRRLMPHLLVMIARFPVLMGIITDRATVEHWDNVHASLAPAAPGTAPEPAYSGDSGGSIPGFVWCVLIFIIGAIIRSVSAPSTAPRYDVPPPVQAPADVPFSLKPPTERDYAPLLDKLNKATSPGIPAVPASRGQPLSRAQLDDINSRIDYKVDKDAPLRTLAVEFDVHLDPGGKVDTVKFTRRSADRRYDDAVEKAVKASKPFPPSTTRMFSLRYWVRITRQRPAQATAAHPAPRETADGAPAVPPHTREDSVRDDPPPAQ